MSRLTNFVEGTVEYHLQEMFESLAERAEDPDDIAFISSRLDSIDLGCEFRHYAHQD